MATDTTVFSTSVVSDDILTTTHDLTTTEGLTRVMLEYKEKIVTYAEKAVYDFTEMECSYVGTYGDDVYADNSRIDIYLELMKKANVMGVPTTDMKTTIHRIIDAALDDLHKSYTAAKILENTIRPLIRTIIRTDTEEHKHWKLERELETPKTHAYNNRSKLYSVSGIKDLINVCTRYRAEVDE